MTKSEQQMWDAIKAHYEKYPEKWTVTRDKDTFAFMSAGVKVLLEPVVNAKSVSCMGIFGKYEQELYWQEAADKLANQQREIKAISVIKALEENS